MIEIKELDVEIDDLAGVDRIESYLRSVYRYLKMLNLEAPDILINTEKDILSRRLSELNHEETVMSYLMWPSFYKERVIMDACLDEQINKDMKYAQPD